MRQTPNAKREKVNIVGGNSFGRYPKISLASTYNMYISDGWLVNTAGYERAANLLADGVGRGIFLSTRGNFLIAVVNSQVLRIDTPLNITVIGTLTTTVGEVFIDENLNQQIAIVDGVNIYIYNWSLFPNLTVQTPVGGLTPNYIEYHNTFFLVGNSNQQAANGSAWYVFQYTAATTIGVVPNGGGVFAIQTKPDNALAVIRLPGQSNNVFVMGTTVSEIWVQVGGLQNYRRNSTYNIDYGCASISTIARSDTFVAWLAINERNSPVIMTFDGREAKPISGFGIDHILSHIKYPAQSTAMLYKLSGHLLYQLTFYNPADNYTFLYDFNTQMFFWLTDHNLNFHPAREYVLFNGTSYFISLTNGALYETSTELTTYNENLKSIYPPNPLINYEIPRVRVCDTLYSDDSAQFRPNSFVMTIEQGQDTNYYDIVGDNPIHTEIDSPLSDVPIYTEGGLPIYLEGQFPGYELDFGQIPFKPRVDLSISIDGAQSFGNPVSRVLNPVAHRQNILNWEKMGACNSWTPMLRFWNMSRFVAYNGMVDVA